MKILTMICDKCSIVYEINYKTYNRRINRATENLCKSCMKEKSIERVKTYWASMTPEEKKKNHCDKIKYGIANMPEDRKNRLHYNRSISHTNWHNSMTKDEKMELSQKIKNGWNDTNRAAHSLMRINYLKGLSSVERNEQIRKMGESVALYWATVDDQYRTNKKLALKKGLEDWRNNMTEEEQKIHSNKLSIGRKNHWNAHPEMKKYFSEIQLNLHANDPSLRIQQAAIRKKWWESLTPEERNEISLNEKKRWASLPEEEKLKIAKRGKDWWNNLTPAEFLIWKEKYTKGRNNTQPKGIEIDFINLINMISIDMPLLTYECQYYNKQQYSEFTEIFKINPVTGSNKISPYHKWDFILHCGTTDILVDIDGSIHKLQPGEFITSDGIDVGMYIQFNDSQRPYQTDGLEAYIVLAYNDKIDNTTLVLNLNIGEMLSMDQFMAIIKLTCNNRSK